MVMKIFLRTGLTRLHGKMISIICVNAFIIVYMDKELKHISKLRSLVLRHQPEYLGITLDENGWAGVDVLIDKINGHGVKIDVDVLQTIVETNDKKRFAFNADRSKIRASQGHSVEVDLELLPVSPPETLYHGTVSKFMESILRQGLLKQERNHVHL